VQPEFLAEEDVAAGKLAPYQALYVVDECVSRAAAEAIDAWVKQGGVLYCSAGAATRDEYDESQNTLAFAQGIWPPEEGEITHERHAYNERGDLPGLQPMARATVTLPDDAAPIELPVLGHRHSLRPDQGTVIGTFDDGGAAAVVREHERGRVLYLGFLPMLAYGQLAGFKPTTLEENWPEAPRRLVKWGLDNAGVQPAVQTDVPVVEATLLDGPNGAVVVLANFTYQPVEKLTVRVRLARPITGVRSVGAGDVPFEATEGGVTFSLPLEWTDLVVLK